MKNETNSLSEEKFNQYYRLIADMHQNEPDKLRLLIAAKAQGNPAPEFWDAYKTFCENKTEEKS